MVWFSFLPFFVESRVRGRAGVRAKVRDGTARHGALRTPLLFLNTTFSSGACRVAWYQANPLKAYSTRLEVALSRLLSLH